MSSTVLARLSAKRALGLSAADQVLSSTSNFVVGVLVGRLAGPGPFGAYIVAFTVWLLVVGIHRALVAEPVIISGGLERDRGGTLRRGLHADLLLGIGLAVAVALVGLVLALSGSGSVGVSLIVLGLVLPVLIMQDYWRAMAFALHRPSVALANDGVFVVVQVISLAIVYGAGLRTAPWFILAWGAGAAAGALTGFFQFGVRPLERRTGPLFAHTWPFSRWLMADFLTIFLADQTYLLLVVALLGQAAFGELRAALSLMGPTAVILLTGGNLGLPRLARAFASTGVEGLVRVARTLTRVVGSAVLIYCSVVVVFGPWMVSVIYGPEFAASEALTRIGALQYAVAACAFGASIAIRVARQARTMWIARLLVTALSVASVLALSAWFGLVGAAWAGVITFLAGAVATRLVFRSYVVAERGGSTAERAVRSSVMQTDTPGQQPQSQDAGAAWPPPTPEGVVRPLFGTEARPWPTTAPDPRS